MCKSEVKTRYSPDGDMWLVEMSYLTCKFITSFYATLSSNNTHPTLLRNTSKLVVLFVKKISILNGSTFSTTNLSYVYKLSSTSWTIYKREFRESLFFFVNPRSFFNVISCYLCFNFVLKIISFFALNSIFRALSPFTRRIMDGGKFKYGSRKQTLIFLPLR